MFIENVEELGEMIIKPVKLGGTRFLPPDKSRPVLIITRRSALDYLSR